MSSKVCICGVDTSLLPKLKNSDMVELMERIKKGDRKARDYFVVANLRLVLSVVHRFGGRGDKADDMFQVGCVGLMKAIDNFDEKLNVKFSTYAVPMIIGEIRRYLRDNNSVRVSRSLRDVAYKALQAKEELAKTMTSEPSIDDIARFTQLPAKTITFALDAISDTVSLSEPVYNDGTDTIQLLDQIADTSTFVSITTFILISLAGSPYFRVYFLITHISVFCCSHTHRIESYRCFCLSDCL